MANPEGTRQKTCFIAMPVTTPATYADELKDPEHFAHVLTHLFTPALEQAGYKVIPPKMLGATLIHAEIIRHLEQADLVLADMSSHNANVFFELGIRTSLDRPVVLVKDKRSGRIPFDLGPINVLEYDESIAPWKLDEEIMRLAEHVSNVPTGDSSGNAMWKYFGLTKPGGPAEAGGLDAKVDLLLGELTKLRLASIGQFESFERRGRRFRSTVNHWAAEAGMTEPPLVIYDENTDSFEVNVLHSALTGNFARKVIDLAEELGTTVSVMSRSEGWTP